MASAPFDQAGRARSASATSDEVPSTNPADLAARTAALRRLEWSIRRRLDGFAAGGFLSTRLGPGTEAAGARLYGPGDDARHIDWKLSARATQIHVRTTDADRELSTWVVVDRSASLDFGTAECEKREVVLGAVTALGFLVGGRGNRVDVLACGGDRLVHHEQCATRPGLLAALAQLYSTPRAEAMPAPGADLDAALARVDRLHRRRGLVVVVSDFLDHGEWDRSLGRLKRRHDVVCVHVGDPRELELPAVGMLTLIDTETGREVHVQTNSRKLRRRYRDAAIARQRSIQRRIEASGAEYVELRTDQDWLTDVVGFLVKRRRRLARTVAMSSHPAGHRAGAST